MENYYSGIGIQAELMNRSQAFGADDCTQSGGNDQKCCACESIQREHNRLQESMNGIIHAMSVVLEIMDSYTAGHQRRVADIACAIAREMKLSEWDIKGIRIAGLLHDVGKLGVPVAILTKPDILNQSEYNIIKNHPQIGYDMLEMIEFRWPVNQAVLQHHERLDGSGYPKGLYGEDVIIDARILSVADVVEAMSSRRPYRQALGMDRVLEEIFSGRDVLYDSRVVDACLNVFQRKEKEFEQVMVSVGAG